MGDTNVGANRDQFMDDFNKVVNDTEGLVRSMANATGDRAIALRDSAQENLKAIKDRALKLQGVAAEKTTAAARATDEYVHENPWPAIGIAAAVGFVVGFLFNERR